LTKRDAGRQESADQYPHVVAQLGPKWRVIEGRDGENGSSSANRASGKADRIAARPQRSSVSSASMSATSNSRAAQLETGNPFLNNVLGGLEHPGLLPIVTLPACASAYFRVSCRVALEHEHIVGVSHDSAGLESTLNFRR
jgi:hypothetical protein